MKPFPHLFSPVGIGNLRLDNRLIMAPMALNYSTERGDLVQRQIDYYVERARGGVGLIVSEASYIRPDGRSAINRLGLYSDDMVPAHRRLVDAIHRENTPIVAQLNHSGPRAPASAIGQYPVAASAVPILTRGQSYVGVVPRALATSEVGELVELFGRAARRAVMAGFDGILVHASNGYLLHSFLSPRGNKRTDRYGGSEENRARFLLEVVRRVREEIGPEMPLLVRVTGEEHMEGGYGADFICRVAQWLEEAGVDEINISAGSEEEQEWSPAPRTFPEGHNVPVAVQVKAAVKTTLVSVVGRIKRPEMANQIIAEGKADLVWMGRALIADPHLPRKAREGRLEDIRECLSCNVCVNRLRDGLDVRCAVNPKVGREGEAGPLLAEKPRRVLVVGGGPAGMEAARVAAQRGHTVTLIERRNRLGGQLLLAAAAPQSKEMERLARHMAIQMEKAGVRVLSGSEATPEAIRESRAQVVIVATGARPAIPAIPGTGLPHVFTAHQVLEGDVDEKLGNRIVVVGGGLTAVSTAEYLLERGHQITLVEMLDWLMSDGSPVEKRTLTRILCERGVHILVKTRADAITTRGVLVTRLNQQELLPADSVVLSVGVRPDRDLLARTDTEDMEVHVIGDARDPRRIQEAIEEGFVVGCRV